VDGATTWVLSYNDLLSISFADAIDDDDEFVDTTVYNIFIVEQVMSKKNNYHYPRYNY
jgi:CBS domain-containing membrane protein